MNNYCVITTINSPTQAVKTLHDTFKQNLIVIGDEKTPAEWEYGLARYYLKSGKSYAPSNHYARKNLGYLKAIAAGAEVIYDTDDDNIPNEIWSVRQKSFNGNRVYNNGWVNIYSRFTKTYTWPRGFPLQCLQWPFTHHEVGVEEVRENCFIQQGLADGSPDVDAIYRMALADEVTFDVEKSLSLAPGAWCPFNSQSTWWFPQGYALMYLPVNATFRMTDIWRSFVAQRCLWEIGGEVGFHSPSEVVQIRNLHDLMKDFEDEIPGYLHNDRIVKILSGLTLAKGPDFVCENLIACYRALIAEGILPQEEMTSVLEWVKDYESLTVK